MKLATFSTGGRPELGLVLGDAVRPLNRTTRLPAVMTELIADWDGVRGEVISLEEGPGEDLPLSAVRLHAPVLRPGKIMAIGLNYADHIAECNLPTPEHQVWFAKTPNSVNGPFDPIELPMVSDALDYEAELVAVVGRGGRNITAGQAPERIFGYCVGNDVTVRDYQHRSGQWTLGKSFDGHAPFGPWITTSDEVGDPHRLGITCRVDGQLRQSSNTRNLVFDVWAQIEHLSGAMTLDPGDVIFTGTPGGVGWAMSPRQFLKVGDVVRVDIEELGALVSPVIRQLAPAVADL